MGSTMRLQSMLAWLAKQRIYFGMFAPIAVICALAFFGTSIFLHKKQLVAAQHRMYSYEKRISDTIGQILDTRLESAKRLLEIPNVRLLCGQLANVLPAAGDPEEVPLRLYDYVANNYLLAQAYDLLFVSKDGSVEFSFKDTPTTKLDLKAHASYAPILNLLDDVSVLLAPSHSSYGYFPQLDHALMVIGVPVLSPISTDTTAGSQSTFCGMLAILVDLQPVQRVISECLAELGSSGDIFVALRKNEKGLLLFNTNLDTSAALKEEFPLEANASIARALSGNLGSSIEVVDRIPQLEIRSYSMKAGWTISVEQLLPYILFVPNLLWALAILFLAIAFISILIFVLFSIVQLQTFVQSHYQQILFIVVAVLLLVCIWWLFAVAKEYRSTAQLVTVQQEAQFKTGTQHTASLVLQQLMQFKSITHEIASTDLQKSPVVNENAITKSFDQFLTKYPSLLALSFVSTTTPPKTIAAVRSGSEISYPKDLLIEQMHKNKSFWIGPTIRKQISPDLILIYAEPMHNDNDTKKERPIGFIYAAFPYSSIKDKVGSLGPKQTPNAMIFKNDGALVYYPDKLFVEQGVLFNEIFRELNPTLKTVQKESEKGYSGSIRFRNKKDNLDYLGIYQSIPESGWTLFVYAKNSDFSVFTSQLHALGKRMVIILVLLLVLWLFLHAQLYLCLFNNLQKFGRIYPLILAGGFLSLLGLYYKEKSAEPTGYIESEVAIDRAKQEMELQLGTAAIPLSTGIQLQYLDIQSPNKITFELKVWQKIYSHHKDIKPGIEIANSSAKVDIYEQHTIKEDGFDTVYWRMRGTIYQLHPQYKQMPFDSQRIEFLLKPAEKLKPVILVPDLDSYRSLDPLQKPGVEPFYLPNFSIEQSFYTYEGQGSNMTLDFNLNVKRNLASVVLQYLLPLFVILLSLFMMALIPVEKLSSRLSFVTADSALFFGLILLHQNVRAITVTTQVSFLEMFILFLYVVIVFSYISILAFYSRNDIPYKRVAFWPLVLTYLFVVATYAF